MSTVPSVAYVLVATALRRHAVSWALLGAVMAYVLSRYFNDVVAPRPLSFGWLHEVALVSATLQVVALISGGVTVGGLQLHVSPGGDDAATILAASELHRKARPGTNAGSSDADRLERPG